MQATDIIKFAGTLEEIQSEVAAGHHNGVRRKNNLHIHLPPNFSAFESIKHVVDTAVKEGVSVLGVTNYYYHDVYEEYTRLAKSAEIFPLFGLEVIAQIDELQKKGFRINDPGNPGRMYLCGKGITGFSKPSKRADELMQEIRDNDRKRMSVMVDKLSALFCERGLNIKLTDSDIISMVAARHGCSDKTIILQERHIALAFQEMFFKDVESDKRIEALQRLYGVPPKSGADDAVGVQGEIRSHCMKAGKPAFVEEKFANFEKTYELIVELGGIPCYPTLADGSSKLCEYESDVQQLIAAIKKNNIHCAEFIPIRNQPDVLERYVKAMRSAGLVVVAGTEHNTLDLLPVEPQCVCGKDVPDEIKEIFWEGACVVVGHMYMSLNGKCGFVDAKGVPNPDYGNVEGRIKAFRAIGETVMDHYFRNN